MTPAPLSKKISLNDLRLARAQSAHMPFLTCYDYTNARLMQRAGVPGILVGDSAANILLGHPTTLPVSLDFMIEITAAVRRGAPLALLMADMPFGSYQTSLGRAAAAVCKMVKLSGCDCVKIEAGMSELPLVSKLTDAGVAVVVHLGLRPQSVGLMGGYRFQGRTAAEATAILKLAEKMEAAGAAALLLEAVPAELAQAVIESTSIPLVGCGAGHPCHGSVIVTPDAMGLTDTAPKFVPRLGDLAGPTVGLLQDWIRMVGSGDYPQPSQRYEMPAEERLKFSEVLRASRPPVA